MITYTYTLDPLHKKSSVDMMVYRIPPLEKGHLLSTVGTAMLLGEHAGELQKDGF